MIKSKGNTRKVIGRMRFFLLIFFIAAGVFSNLSASSLSDSIVMNAMRDELHRNFNELNAPGYEKPFYISYTIANANNIQLLASLGALVRSDETQYKDWSVRVMVGNYEINDENFTSSQPGETIFRPSLDMPVEDDYMGIRRSLWLTTNNVYLQAAQLYKNKMAQIEHKQLAESDLEIADFSRAPVIQSYVPNTAPDISKELLEKKIKNLSYSFIEYPEIFSSTVSLNCFRSTVFFINSEGAEVQFPFNITVLNVQAGTLADDSERLNRNITYISYTPDELPSDTIVKKDIHTMAGNLLALRSTPRFEDTYYGPVLIAGEIAAETLEKFLFAGTNSLVASRENLQSSHQMNISYEQSSNAFQSGFGKQVLSRDLTITAEPFMKEFQGIPLLGNFAIDAEGVVPHESLVLVEKGTVKTLLNGRTPSRFVPESNGHMRFDFSQRGVRKQTGPGVIRIHNANPVPLETMKTTLLELAKAEGNEYAIIIRSLDTEGSDKPFNYYQVDVETGEEKLIRSVRLKNLTLQALRRSPVFSDSIMVHNTLLSLASKGSTSLTGMPSSFILPYAVLFNEVELESTRKPLTSMLPILENPVGKNENTVISTPESGLPE